ncbi:cytochrome c biogenesis protein CcmG/thiol:disulfide interchange protein DsbE [Rhodothalassium salexigens DSM 2132]|uniref:Cytochrome c biogenesis protein CcmG/thiol:disulfide interchange protein DsbE n=1 Tax=Rhodothalassium salexigens DSM 2132 TaxID=1188247 RepID=A0A4R2PBW4_RHOSA|nr:DsbE family thiol:disulfide interchange protein [Rhodothalassium salexigens]MBB4212332.1 cytochrome c biogenesis protein CcmG/thiol:disulfide interchange protein DsbE [Rhodothalassium salexigens DSM 2132]MBK1638832.1 hypothetical protein [Rhodothalassium salexigens DSM 2132]TCP32517.1 cytochrome c biogenesis protein CcmG/thiol:disulfide interchange protein DsbE [Rhodothalassium salexigens DSM 2132]
MSWRALLPIAVFIALTVLLYGALSRNPRELNSALIDKPAPTFDLPALYEGGPGLSSDDLRAGRPAIVNVFASWCTPCRAEHPQLMTLSDRLDLPVYGINYKDTQAAGQRFLDDLGNPYDAVGVDADGRLGIDLGVYGVPETYVVDGQGVIRFKHAGPLTPRLIETELMPALEAAGRVAGPQGEAPAGGQGDGQGGN